ncbi:MAG TPA: glycosyltransferase family 2 protein [Nitrosomonas europaea]|uniref:glycosyltransferase family 2 protein n=1 Tax=Nitrosomonas europaea TaxID=915 RepID=UPI00249255F9|nr:glycosyltransferase family 2 protein [Nitrosomonas europaea]HRO57472.1 glycosyltransferase family 2 protein [Nitrosomonas europaea]HUM75070.1 glycosyltransferase family 2 protein [Nitrosomonas europaea]
MAKIIRNENNVEIVILDHQIDESHPTLFIANQEQVSVKLETIKIDKNIFVINNIQFLPERFIINHPRNLQLTIKLQDSNRVISESLEVEPSFLIKHIDLSTSQTFPPFTYTEYAKPEEIAVFTHCCNETIFLDLFLSHYKKITKEENIFVIDHGSIHRLKKGKHQIIRIPKGETDHLNIKRFVEYFQRFLLTQYKWVIHVDSDELLVHKNGSYGLLNELREIEAPTIIKPRYAFELIEGEEESTDLDLTKKITDQRKYYIPAPSYHKPVIASAPTVWILGFHHCLNDSYIATSEGMAIVHLAHISSKEAVRRNKLWKKYSSTQADAAHVPQETRQTSINCIKKDYSRKIKENLTHPPEWVTNQF